MQLSDERIKLLPLDESCLQLFSEFLTCSQLMEHISTPFTQDKAKAEFECRSQPWNIKSDGWLSLPITEIKPDKKVGFISLRILNHEANIAEVGFILEADTHGRGIASAALKLIKEYALNELNLNKLVAFCSVHNTASYNLLEKLGFVREGCFMQHTLINDKYVDVYAYGLCKSAL
ncbi:MAG: GNAT family N-acetyltransferase [Colwellia sp.]